MFTGIVEQRGTVTALVRGESVTRLEIEMSPGDLARGSSVSVNGVCLTAVGIDDGVVGFDVIGETLSRTNLGDLEVGDVVNLERPTPATGRFDGHIVQGHVDGTGEIESVERDDRGTVMTIVSPPELMRHIVEKGSVTLDGVSLTVSATKNDTFQVSLIPHTLEVTTLGLRLPGDKVNLETDVLAKYVERLLKT